MSSYITINNRAIGPGHPTYIIAELSANHHQELSRAIDLVHLAKEAGADAIKLQTYTADTMTINSKAAPFQIGKGTIWEGKNLYQLYQEAHTPWEWQPKLMKEAKRVGLDCFSTPFDDSSVNFLESLDVPAYKIASFELVDLPLIKRVARTEKPVIMSTGMATFGEIQEAVSAFRDAGGENLILLKCTSAYPSRDQDMNLRTITHLKESFGVPVGLSDHSMGIAVPIAAVMLGACVIEKHITQSRAIPGPDSAFSLECSEFKAMVDAVRSAEKAIGEVNYNFTENEAATRIFRRSLFVVKDVRKGELFTSANVRSIRPAHGLSPKHLCSVIGKPSLTDVTAGTPLSWELIGPPC